MKKVPIAGMSSYGMAITLVHIFSVALSQLGPILSLNLCCFKALDTHIMNLLMVIICGVWQANGSSNVKCSPNVEIDPSPSNVNMLLGLAEEMLKQKNVESVLFGGKRIAEQTNYEKLDWIAAELVLEHQRRSCRIAPTVAFKQVLPSSNP